MSDNENTQREETGVEESIITRRDASEETDPGEEVVLELAGVTFLGKHFGALSRG